MVDRPTTTLRAWAWGSTLLRAVCSADQNKAITVIQAPQRPQPLQKPNDQQRNCQQQNEQTLGCTGPYIALRHEDSSTCPDTTCFDGHSELFTDSFSGDGADAASLAQQAAEMVAAGATWLDVGAVSSRPGADVVSEAEEWRQQPVLPIALATGAQVSVDTRRGVIARQALGLGVHMVNDIAGGSDPTCSGCCSARCRLVPDAHAGRTRHHARQSDHPNDDVVGAVTTYLRSSDKALLLLAFPPTIFTSIRVSDLAKPANVSLLSALPAMRRELGGAWLLGISRKRFLPALVGQSRPAAERGWSYHPRQLASWSDILRVRRCRSRRGTRLIRLPGCESTVRSYVRPGMEWPWSHASSAWFANPGSGVVFISIARPRTCFG